MKAFASFAEQDVLQEALRRIGVWAPDWLPTFAAKAKEAKRSKRPAARVAAAADRAELQWTETRGKRKRCWGPPSGSERKAFRSAVLADQRFAKKRFFGDVPRRARGKGDDLLAIVPNDSDLPAANLSATSIGLQKWCEEGSWGMCPKCHVLQPRPMQPSSLDRVDKPYIAASACRRCKALHPHRVPVPEDVPTALRNLTPAIIAALRPLDMDVGPESRAENGYRKKLRMIRFSWALESVSDKIRALPSEERQQAKAAFKYLKKCEVSEYKDYHARHVAFLTRHRGNPTESQARRPLHFIEEAGLETALWPHLYWETAMCESFERLTDRRLNQLDGRKRARRTYGDDDSTSEDEEEAEEDEEKEERRHSIKRSFQTKLLSPLLGYGNDFQLLQYVYDLHLWTDLGSKRNQADRLGGHAMRLMMRGHPMSPLYWADLKYSLFDLVRQLGFPHLYWTLAPYERLPTFEVMHMAHTMFQICRGLLAGQGQAKGVGWTRHVLGQPEVAEAKLQPKVHFFTRLEFRRSAPSAIMGAVVLTYMPCFGCKISAPLNWRPKHAPHRIGLRRRRICKRTCAAPSWINTATADGRCMKNPRPSTQSQARYNSITHKTMPRTACGPSSQTCWMLYVAIKISSWPRVAGFCCNMSRSMWPSGLIPPMTSGFRTALA